ncbi:MAG: 5-demethoxyubiquinol-8 5-hydroxylase UbiM [Proteobacteria bacterium]|nr:5-demethoxyubiquinol-8 5-hydroxylase UbiM [Pseudomonadota bacterium]MCH8100691.1 5-demethoxyubiquinol-8 5-hydroxylase UbiM [Pseudomonadota bacterium]
MTYDVVIIGAGPAGLSFARSIARSKLRIALIEKQSTEQLAAPKFDGRDIALTHLSVRILKDLGIWERFEPDDRPPINSARVMNGASPYCLTFECAKDSIDPLGYIVSNHIIRKALFDEVQNFDNIEVLSSLSVTSVATNDDEASVVLSDGQKLVSHLVVAADSRFSETRRMMGIPASMHDFGRICIVCRMEHQRPHDGIAFECFHYGRTLAVLPLTDRCSSIVVTAPMDQHNLLMDMDDSRFSSDVQHRFDSRYGDMKLVSKRFAYPLVAVHASNFYAQRFALIGDAAVGMHPVTAHGYNLGLSGQEILAQEVNDAASRSGDIGARPLLERYQRKHMRSTKPMYHGTNEIVKFFTDDRVPAKLARRVALRLANRIPLVKRLIQSKLTASFNRIGITTHFPL